jgi:hypothetical protein
VDVDGAAVTMMEAAATVVAEAAGVHGGQQLIDPASACLCPAQGCATDEGCGCGCVACEGCG